MKIRWISMVRVTGLLLVLIYHFYPKILPGGFLGVDVFFTFSGYLITALLIDEFLSINSIELKAFYKRRLYRIVPPVILMIMVSLPFALLVRNDFIAGIWKQIIAATGFMTNYFEILTSGSYENQFTPHIFVHTWSLAVEVHFYLLWGFVAFLLARHFKKEKNSSNDFRRYMLYVSIVAFLISFIAMIIGAIRAKEFSGIYFSTLTHSFPFFLGSIVAVFAGIKNTSRIFNKMNEKYSKLTLWIVIITCLIFLIQMGRSFHFDNRITYFLGFVLASIFTGLLIIAGRLLHEKTNRGEPKLISYLSSVSYGIYLFHWPLHTIFAQLNDNIAAALTTALSFAFATLSYYVLEPIIAGKKPEILADFFESAKTKKFLKLTFSILATSTLAFMFFSPSLGTFEKDMMIQELGQSQTQMVASRALASNSKADSYNVADGEIIIGDSVTLRARSSFKKLMPDASLDAAGSRNLAQARELIAENKANGTLSKNVIVAAGVNVVSNYKEELDSMIKEFPQGHRLILVTPYDGNSKDYSDPIAEKTYKYELKLAKKYAFVTLADWHKASIDNPKMWEGSDNIHFGTTRESMEAAGDIYVNTIKKAVEGANKGAIKD